jgi:putative ABC transport system permease protein
MLIAIVLISIMNVMIMAVYERIREIGTIAAMGTLPGKILSMFVLEGLCMGAAGAVIGSILSGVVIYSAVINPMDLLTVCGIVIVVSILASLQPALKAARMDPIQALGHV